MIVPIECEPASVWDERVNKDGGWYLVTEDAEGSQIVEACEANNVKGHWVRRPDIHFLSELSNLKYLNLIYDVDDVSPIYELQNLEQLTLVSWGNKTFNYGA